MRVSRQMTFSGVWRLHWPSAASLFNIFTGKNTSSAFSPELVTGITRFVIFKILPIRRLAPGLAGLSTRFMCPRILRMVNGLIRWFVAHATSDACFIM